jgi:hypothetical protein
MERQDSDKLAIIYAEAGKWINLCNTITWSMGAILIPLSIGCIGLAQQYPARRRFFAVASVFLFAVWVYVCNTFRTTAAKSRDVLINIEKTWEVPEQMSLYKLHGQIGLSRYNLFKVLIICLILLTLLWVILLLIPV